MTFEEAMNALESYGTDQNIKIYGRHGVSETMFGVSYANQKALAKKIKKDHDLAGQLWRSGNHDARILATMIAEPAELTEKELDAWVLDLENYVATDALAGLVAKSALSRKKMEEWVRSDKEFVAACGWGLMARLAMTDQNLPDDFFLAFIDTIRQTIHEQKNRVRHSMNGALIAIGLRNERLRGQALQAADAIGRVQVDHGQTSCKTPDARGYILKAAARAGKKRSKPVSA